MSEWTLQKFLQQSGFGNRRAIRQLIAAGKFLVNGKAIRDPHYPVRLPADTICYGKKRLAAHVAKNVYYLLHKPARVVTTLHDPQGRPTIADFIGKIRERVYPVGRLDFHSEGLILLTNDGLLSNFILSARNKIPKVYQVKIKGTLSDAAKEKLAKGVFWEGRRLQPFQVRQKRCTPAGNAWLEVVIREGKKHIVRNAFQAVGHPVEKLKRTAIGSFQLRRLPAGHWRELTAAEVTFFKKRYAFRPDSA